MIVSRSLRGDVQKDVKSPPIPHPEAEVQEEEVNGQAGAPTVGECDALAAETTMQAQKMTCH